MEKAVTFNLLSWFQHTHAILFISVTRHETSLKKR